ncbi:hypothetical protein HTVC028P_gp49 [Pelagibacter phage HTVC028P]|nr:hypothetical protein HTVC028P_gp49 [Pelagibacter phage HTVC028P]
MGSRGDSGGDRDTSANNVPPSRRKYQPVTGTLSDPREKDDTAAKMDLFYERGATNIKNTASKVPTPTLAILSGPLQAGSRKNREFFTDKVLGSKNFKGTTKDDFQKLSATEQESMYTDYMSGRQSGKTDAYGNEISQSTLGRREQKSLEQPKVASQMDNTGVKSDLITADKTAPTDVEMTDDEYNIATKKKGRRRTVLTSVTGDTSKPTLSKKVLLS